MSGLPESGQGCTRPLVSAMYVVSSPAGRSPHRERGRSGHDVTLTQFRGNRVAGPHLSFPVGGYALHFRTSASIAYEETAP